MEVGSAKAGCGWTHIASRKNRNIHSSRHKERAQLRCQARRPLHGVLVQEVGCSWTHRKGKGMLHRKHAHAWMLGPHRHIIMHPGDTHAHAHRRKQARTHTRSCARTHGSTQACMCALSCTHAYALAHPHTLMCTHAHTRARTRAHTHTHTHAHTYTHICTLMD